MNKKCTIEKITAQEILDARGIPTLKATIHASGGITASASVPSGTSTSTHEVFELRDGDMNRYGGLGVRQACKNINDQISRSLKGFDLCNQANIDEELKNLDGTHNLRKLGANAVVGVSLAAARTAALSQEKTLYHYLAELHGGQVKKKRLPVPLFNIFNGGKHADTNLDFQEFIIIPGGIHASFEEQLRAGAEIFHTLKSVLLNNGLDTDVGTEGGFAPNIDNTMQALDLIMQAIKESDYEAGQQIQLGMDVGASVLYDHDRKLYHFGLLDHDLTTNQLISLYNDWAHKYPFIFIEDGLYEDDWENWRKLSDEFKKLSHGYTEKNFNQEFMIAGDDIFSTNPERLQSGIDQEVANTVIVKPNQIGTLTDTLKFTKLAQENNYKVVVSHRSGETMDDFIADLSVGVGADYIKAGSLARGERLAKYNRLLEIESELTGSKSK